MEFQINRKNLLKALNATGGAVEKRQTVPILSHFFLNLDDNGLQIIATDLEIEIRSVAKPEKIIHKGMATIPAKKIMDICRVLPEEAFMQISITDEKALIVADKSKFSLATLPASKYPHFDEIAPEKSFSLASKQLVELLQKTHFAMANQDVRHYLNGVMLQFSEQKLFAVATNGHRLAMSQMEANNQNGFIDKIIIPRKGIIELLHLLDTEENEVLVECSAQTIRIKTAEFSFAAKLIDGKFPELSKIIPERGNVEFIQDRDVLKNAFSRIAVLSSEKYNAIILEFLPNILKVKTNNPEQEAAEEDLVNDYQGEPFEVAFNVRYLLEVLAVMPSGEVRWNIGSQNGSAIIESVSDPHSIYVVMPMRL